METHNQSNQQNSDQQFNSIANNQPQQNADNWHAPLNRVTTTSKVLAGIIFITLPFVGGYVGYLYALEKVVEVENQVQIARDTADIMIPSKVITQKVGNDMAVQNSPDNTLMNIETFTHPTDGYSFQYDKTQYQAETISGSEYIPNRGFVPSAQVTKGYVQKVEIHIFNGNLTSAQSAYISMYNQNFEPKVLKTENITINGLSTIAQKISLDSSRNGFTVYFIEVSSVKTIIATGDFDIIATLKI